MQLVSSDTWHKCSECGHEAAEGEDLLQIGEPPDHGSHTAWLCLPCAAKIGTDGQPLARLVVDLMNEALQADNDAVQAMMAYRIGCNDALADHPTIEVAKDFPGYAGMVSVGLLGIIQAIARTVDGPESCVVAVCNDDGLPREVKLFRPGQLDEFRRIKPEQPDA